MNKIQKKIISIGGGGFTHQSDKSLDEFILNQSETENINIGFLATASKDDKKKINFFYNRFEKLNLQLSHFNLCTEVRNFSDWILNKDIIYIGGGNTAYMLDLWKKNTHKLHLEILVFYRICHYAHLNHYHPDKYNLLQKILQNIPSHH